MTELHADGWYTVTGRGLVAAIKNLADDVDHPGEYMNRYVVIDGEEYYVTGVETFAIYIGSKGKYPKHLGFGLLVRRSA